MNHLIEEKMIEEVIYAQNFAYIVNDANLFRATEYKVLQSQSQLDNCFIKSMKMLLNGKIQIYYFTKEFKSLSALLPTINEEEFLTIMTNLLSDIIEVKNNGFLSCQNVDISFQHIYVDPVTYKVSLIYLPLNKRLYEDDISFENEFRIQLIKLISESPRLSAPKVKEFSEKLANGSLRLEDIYANIKGVKNKKVVVKERKKEREESAAQPGELRLVTINSPEYLEIKISKDDFVIGKKAELCDGVIAFNKMVSRTHCKINKLENQYVISDLQSLNGTFVNQLRLQPNHPHPICNGDIIRLANSDFQVKIQ